MIDVLKKYGAVSFNIVLAVSAALLSNSSQAVPSFAQQTGQPCTSCHVGGFGPQLTPYGVEFKLGGYTASDGKDGHVPLSAMAVESWTRTSKDQSADAGPYDGTNNNASLQQLSVFIAGAMTDHLGAFAQTTYSDINRKVAMDNIDIRYARSTELFGEDAILGVTVNNTPTVQDPSNSVAAWRFPYMSSDLAPTPMAAPLIDGGLAQQVIGLSGYGYWNDAIYAEIGGYKTLSKSFLDKVNADSSTAISGIAPYWRLSYMKSSNERAYSAGLFGMNAALLPDRTPGAEDRFSDIGFDANYQWLGDRTHVVTVNAAYVHEKQTLNATFESGGSENRDGNLDKLDIGASYYYQQTYGLSLAYFDIQGKRDNGLYAIADPDAGSSTGKPDSSGWIMQADWTPLGKAGSWGAPRVNLRVGLQYTLYDKFNGATHNYDGYGRNASDNNTLFGFVWLAF